MVTGAYKARTNRTRRGDSPCARPRAHVSRIFISCTAMYTHTRASREQLVAPSSVLHPHGILQGCALYTHRARICTTATCLRYAKRSRNPRHEADYREGPSDSTKLFFVSTLTHVLTLAIVTLISDVLPSESTHIFSYKKQHSNLRKEKL